MTLTTHVLRGMIGAMSEAITAHQDELDRLDATVGDGDHGTGISAGFQAAVEMIREAKSPADVLRCAATALMNRMGGGIGCIIWHVVSASRFACQGSNGVIA
jgi:dihydroxyacetone kinase-like protein